jgi:hypothetical protein
MTKYRERKEAGLYEPEEAEAAPEPAVAAGPTASELDAMTKDELLEKAVSLGVVPANAGMTKDEIRAGIDAKLAEGG